MRLALKPHPDSYSSTVLWIEVELDLPAPTVLKLRYLLGGCVAKLELPENAPSTRADGLWQSTCFELFLKQPGETGYLEFNFSPSTQWAVYGFTGYREGMHEASERLAPSIRFQAAPNGITLSAEVQNLPGLPWLLGLSAVIAGPDGRKSHWALAHPRGAPDFHHPDCFALELAPPAEPL